MLNMVGHARVMTSPCCFARPRGVCVCRAVPCRTDGRLYLATLRTDALRPGFVYQVGWSTAVPGTCAAVLDTVDTFSVLG
jgi:hypothetical protein